MGKSPPPLDRAVNLSIIAACWCCSASGASTGCLGIWP